ncbi:MAG: hypothetical protein IJU60_05715 [Acholeplasmatales bacterium]|nr:hypothetical protein [Acholeplasmatales bacterium]
MKEVKLSSLIGFLCFIALMLAGTAWLLSLPGWKDAESIVLWIKHIAVLILIACGLVFGFIWLHDAKMNKTLKIVLMVFFILFAVLAIIGVVK